MDDARDRYGGAMTKRMWNLLTIGGAVLAVVAVVGGIAAVSQGAEGETFPGWVTVLFWVGVLVVVGAQIGRGVTKS